MEEGNTNGKIIYIQKRLVEKCWGILRDLPLKSGKIQETPEIFSQPGIV